MYQSIAPYLDVIWYFALGGLSILVPERFVSRVGTGKDRQKRMDRRQVVGGIFFAIGIFRLLAILIHNV
jgi:hypothetical protein